MAILVASFHANLFVAELAERTIGHSRVKTAHKIRRETCERFVAELTPTAEILHVIAAVKGHVEPFNLQRSVGVWDVSHLFKPMEMVQRRDEEILTGSKIAAWTHINPLAVTRILLIQGMLEKKARSRA